MDSANKDGDTALIWASLGGHCDVVMLLLQERQWIQLMRMVGLHSYRQYRQI